MSKDYWDKKVEVNAMVEGHTLSKKQAEKARRAKIIEEAGSTPASELYTDEQWARLMWAGHSEVSEIMRDIADENAKSGKGIKGMKKMHCFDSVEVPEWGGECYLTDCKWHNKDEPMCGANK